ncbi:MAG TPA: alpha-L-arabinofuranosidase C-terminal domain-containing protein, partial [Chthonomonadales bacterium]|nr:alpha-L-arabinofuranosidase C-terminal domain-containing protein [Chthonomonadales bacterium]
GPLEPVQVELTGSGAGPTQVDNIEIYPSDNLMGMDRQIVMLARALHASALRYPGGNFAEGYHWQDALGMPERRPTTRNAAWGGAEPNRFGINEYMRLCRIMGAQPQLVVNAGNGTPQEAAGWVSFCNSSLRNRYGLMRASSSSPEPYDVSLWEIGNELYGPWEIGHTDAAGNAQRYVEFRNAMLAADKSIHLIATGKGNEYSADGLKRDAQWNDELLRQAVANGGPAPDYLSIHPLLPLPSIAGNAGYQQSYQSAMAFPTYFESALAPEVSHEIQAVEGPKASTKIAVTEWGLIVGGAGWQNNPNANQLAGALFCARFLNALLRRSDTVTLANVTGLMHGGGIKKDRGMVYVDPQYYVQQQYAAAQLQTPVFTSVSGPSSDVPARGGLPAVSNVPDLDLFAALTPQGRRLVLFVVNSDPASLKPLDLTIRGFAAASVAATILTGASVRATNSALNPNNVKPAPLTLPAYKNGTGWRIDIPARSVVELAFSHDGSR